MSLGDADEAPDDASETPDDAHRTANLRALAHPLRLRILSLLTSGAFTAAEVARELDVTHANASYHLRQLHAVGVVELVGEERIRGGVAKRYRYNIERDLSRPPRHPGEGESTALDPLIYTAHLTELRRRIALGRRAMGNYLADGEFWVDPDVWREVRDQIADAAARLHRAAQLPRTPGAIHVSASVVMFRMED
ncbi:ArsR/SmtB family transcription factor [Plantactinospora sp. GCM10030261]|uniref:ArsR/SmtB family transcription factor n=1 Tax=Plantactinospora sp. GCM10030261 TaxID=3273420 RepID=UPI003618375B